MSYLLMCHRTTDDETEAEPVQVDLAGTTVAFTLDDGEILTFDAADLVGLLLRPEVEAA